MTDDRAEPVTAPQGPGKLAQAAARAALRAIDATLAAIEAGAGAVQRLRNRIESTEAEGERGAVEGKRRRSGDDEAATVGAPAAAPKTLLRRFLIVVMCLLIGGVTATLISHRSFSRQLDAQEKRFEFMQDELKGARRDEMRILAEKRQLYKELAEYKTALNEARAEIEEHAERIAELSKRLPESRDATRSVERVRPKPAPVTTQPRRAPKVGTCVTGTANPAGDLLDCIGKFNQ